MNLRPIPNFPNYQVSDVGEVLTSKGKLLSPHNSRGYRHISLTDESGIRRGVGVHRLVASAFIGPIPKGMWVNHKDGNKANNNINNLEITTPSENQRHYQWYLKRKNWAYSDDIHELTPTCTAIIRVLLNRGLSHKEVSNEIAPYFPKIASVLAGNKPN